MEKSLKTKEKKKKNKRTRNFRAELYNRKLQKMVDDKSFRRLFEKSGYYILGYL